MTDKEMQISQETNRSVVTTVQIYTACLPLCNDLYEYPEGLVEEGETP
jgi:hypothetical protein